MLYDISLQDAGGFTCSNIITLELPDNDDVAKRKATQLYKNGSLTLNHGYSVTDVWSLSLLAYSDDSIAFGVRYEKPLNDNSSLKNQWLRVH